MTVRDEIFGEFRKEALKQKEPYSPYELFANVSLRVVCETLQEDTMLPDKWAFNRGEWMEFVGDFRQMCGVESE